MNNMPIMRLIQRKMPSLTGKARVIAQQILSDPEKLIQEKTVDLARRSGTD